MYERFYGLNEKPFQIVPNPDYLYQSDTHRNALTYLEYGLGENVGMVLLTGEVGCGKTTLVQYVLRQLGPETTAAVIFNTNVTAAELLKMILTQFEQAAVEDKAANLDALNYFLIQTFAAGKKALLVIDEAQNLSPEALEEVRMLSNLQTDSHTLLQIVLVGQPELKAQLEHPSMRQVAQRIAVRYHLTGLNREDTCRYIDYRMQVAGGEADRFTAAAVGLIYKISRGIPRAINLACQAALVYGFAEGAPRITQDIIKKIVADNLGVGIAAAGAGTEAEAGEGRAQEGPAGSGRKAPGGGLDPSFKDVLTRLDDRLELVARDIATSNNGAFQRVSDMLQQEHNRNRELERRFAQLELKYKALRNAYERAMSRPEKIGR